MSKKRSVLKVSRANQYRILYKMLIRDMLQQSCLIVLDKFG